MEKIYSIMKHIINVLMAFCLAAMALFVFGNVVLRYFFDSGITWSEEMSRYLFVYLVFFGAIAALKDNEHLGVDILVRRLPLTLRRIVYVISNGIVLYTLYLLGQGSWKMTILSGDTHAPATGLPFSFVYVVGVITSACMAIILIVNIIRVIIDKDSIHKLSRTVESEEEIIDHHVPAETQSTETVTKLDQHQLRAAEGADRS
ncbi:C4-dicarboxylate ABC transporter permease [Cohnella kolymensis]|uniref:C4-dicarboxylate ABC transporter permease n=1 Tax=Cohnella kolymensis TaxID=1590652 RepID=A0ABR5A442_9BACL|nr:TRAP transporter small permease [Cohnella kolymensis]KIL35818.1 C4-dicarboxylate ABC transporter permease [Cohnella kolymensis]